MSGLRSGGRLATRLVATINVILFHSKFSEGSGSGIPNQRLSEFVLFKLSTTWLNRTVGMNRNFGMSVNTAVVAMTLSNTM